MTPLGLWGGDILIYKSIIALSAGALPTIAVVNWFLRGTPSWPQLALAGSTMLVALFCCALAHRGKRDVAAALLIGLIWLAATIYAFESGYGMHSAVVFMYLPCILYSALFFGLAIASAELALTVAVLVLMYFAEEAGQLGGASAFATHGTNFNFLVGVIITSIGTLTVGVVYHRRVEGVAARVFAEAEQRRLAMEQAQAAQALLETAHAKLQAQHAALEERDRSREQEMTRLNRDLALFHDAVSNGVPPSLQALRDALADFGRYSQAQLQREPLDLSALAHQAAATLRGDFPHVRFDIDANLRATGDSQLLAALVGHLVRRAATACKPELQPKVRVGTGSRDGQAMFFVRDNGPGMDAAQRAQLFRPFEPGRTEDKMVDIGIVNARRIVERHGGELVVDSAPGGGTTFFFSLPAVS